MYLGNLSTRSALNLAALLAAALLFRSPPVAAENPPPSLLFHIGPAVADQAFSYVPGSPDSIVTSALANPDGSASYFVYLLGTSETGIIGMMFGITYDENAPGNPGLAVHSWHRYWFPGRPGLGMEFPTEDWPAPGSGNVLTWMSEYADCGDQPLFLPGGYFYVTAYGPSVLAIESNPVRGQMAAWNCNNVQFSDLEPGRVGWVSLGGAALGSDADGCNPVLESCVGPVPAVPSTWGKMKARYGSSVRP